jgi:hypothetical protein
VVHFPRNLVAQLTPKGVALARSLRRANGASRTSR